MANVPQFMGLPTRGAMGEEPAFSVSGIMGIVAVVVGVVVQLTGITIPPDLQSFADQWGSTIVGLAIAVYTLVTGYFIRQRVVSPATAVEKGARSA